MAGPGFLLLANMPFDAQSVGIMGRFYILVNMFWVFGIMWGLEIVVRAAGRPWAARLVLKLAAVLVIFAAWSSPMHYSWRDYYLEYDYGRNLLKTLPHGSTLFMDGGDDTFYSTGYLTFAQGLRPDVELHDRGGLVFKSIYGEDFRRLEKKAKESRRLTCEYGYLARGKKIYYSTFDENVLPGVGVVADGILLRPKAYGKSDAWDSYSLRSVYGKDYDDYRSRALVPLYPYFEAVHSNDRDYLVYDLKKWSDVVWMPGNIKFKFLRSAYDSFSAGKLDEAEGTYRLTLKYFPQETSAMLNLGVIEEKRNNLAGALELYNQAISVEPSNLDAYYNLSVIYWKQSRWDKAADCYRKMLAINPGDARANQYLAVVMKKIGGK